MLQWEKKFSCMRFWLLIYVQCIYLNNNKELNIEGHILSWSHFQFVLQCHISIEISVKHSLTFDYEMYLCSHYKKLQDFVI